MKWNFEAGELIMKNFDTEFEIEAAEDPDEYDETGEVNDPSSPIWEGSDVQDSCYGNDPSTPDSNDITED
jgi:hypothetical protein